MVIDNSTNRSDQSEKNRLVEACTSAGGLPSLLPDVAKVLYNAQDVSTLKQLKAALGPEAWSQLKSMNSRGSQPSGDIEVISQMLEVAEGNEVASINSHNSMLMNKDKIEGREAAEKGRSHPTLCYQRGRARVVVGLLQLSVRPQGDSGPQPV